MTKKELKQKMLDFIGRQDHYSKEEWYATNYDICYDILTEFAKEELG